jgi:hypothetical protein
MKRLLLSVVVGGFALSAIAQDAPDASIWVNANDITLPAKPYKMFPEDWDAFKGTYDMSNGQTMVLRRTGLRMYARIASRPPQELVAAAENEFVAVYQQLKMRLVDEGLGHVTGQMVMAVAPQGAQQSNAMLGDVLLLGSR